MKERGRKERREGGRGGKERGRKERGRKEREEGERGGKGERGRGVRK